MITLGLTSRMQWTQILHSCFVRFQVSKTHFGRTILVKVQNEIYLEDYFMLTT
jgi:hypothetical protein